MNSIEKALAKLTDKVLATVKDVMQRAPAELSVYVNENFGEDTRGIRPRERNTTTKLRVVKAKLSRATLPKEEGNITRVTADDDGIVIESGVDLGTVPYARIHELGGIAGRGARIPKRPYLKPGMEAFQKDAMPRYLKRISELLAKGY